MALPTIGIPTYEVSLPSNGTTVKFRPFLVKEEKILLIALETGDKKGQSRALKQIIKNCIMSDLNIDTLPIFDIEYLFIQIRGKSVGETLEPTIVCPNCKTTGKLKVPLADIGVNKDSVMETPHKIMFNNTVGMTLVYPEMKMIEDIDPDKASSGNDAESIFKIIVRCIDQIFDGEEIHNPKNYTEKELNAFLEGVPTESFKKIVEFVSSMPRVEKKVNFRCPTCGIQKEIMLRGIEDFFGSVSPTTA